MRTIDIHQATANLFNLVEQAARGQSFLISVSGRPRVMVIAVDAPAAGHPTRLGLLEGVVCVPEESDRVGQADIERPVAHEVAAGRGSQLRSGTRR